MTYSSYTVFDKIFSWSNHYFNRFHVDKIFSWSTYCFNRFHIQHKLMKLRSLTIQDSRKKLKRWGLKKKVTKYISYSILNGFRNLWVVPENSIWKHRSDFIWSSCEVLFPRVGPMYQVRMHGQQRAEHDGQSIRHRRLQNSNSRLLLCEQVM